MILVIVGYEYQDPAVILKILGPQAQAVGKLALFPPPIIEHQQGVLNGYGKAGMMKIRNCRKIWHRGLLAMWGKEVGSGKWEGGGLKVWSVESGEWSLECLHL